jgi:ATP-dependent DNA ligase
VSKGDFPQWLEPMAATLTQERFAHPDWLFERKFDGIRLLAFKRGSSVRLLSRNKLPQNDRCPSIVAAVAALPYDVILDGELTGGYHVFDILWHDDQLVTQLPLIERRALLRSLPLEPPLHRVAQLVDERPWETACNSGWEGVIAKRLDAPYQHRRSPLWLKMKCEITEELVVGGFTDPQGRRAGLGALLVGHYQGDDFVYAGKVGTGFDTRMLIDLRARLDALEIPKAPFTKAVGLPRVRAHWVRPQIKVEVAFIEWTVHGKLRHPRLLRVYD